MSEQIKKGVIEGYRNLLQERYQYDKIKAAYNLPPALDETRVENLKAYFLNYVYPPPERRAVLEAAFEDLDNYIKNPQKLLRILIDSGSLIFKYGRHLPKILGAGLNALKSFRLATQLEYNLVKNAIDLGLNPPYNSTDIKTLLSALTYEELIAFTKHNEALFQVLYDRNLVQKIIEIVEHLIRKMKKRPNVYTATEVDALALGRDIIKEGNRLFAELNRPQQEQVLSLVLQFETDFIKSLFE